MKRKVFDRNIIKEIGSFIICFLMIAICLLSISVALVFGIKEKKSVEKTGWLLRRATTDLSWKKDLFGKYELYDKDKTKVERAHDLIEGVKKTIEDFSSSALPISDYIKSVADVYSKGVLHSDIEIINEQKPDSLYVEETIEMIEDLSKYLDENSIGFLYVQLPSYERIENSDEWVNKDIKNAALLFEDALDDTNVPHIDIEKNGAVMSGIRLDASKHWYPADALATTKEIAKELNSSFGFSYNIDTFEEGQYYNICNNVDSVWQEVKAECGYNYEVLVPNNNISYNADFHDKGQYEGDFRTVMLRERDKWNVSGPYHEVFRLTNGTLGEIHNIIGSNNPGKRIVILGDSFSWPITCYLAQDTEYMCAFNPIYNSISVKKYIEVNNPDLVIMMFSEDNLSNKMNLVLID